MQAHCTQMCAPHPLCLSWVRSGRAEHGLPFTQQGSLSWSPRRAPVGCHPSPKGFPMRLRNAGFPRQAGAGSSLTSSSKLNTLDFLHQPLPPGTEKRAGWPVAQRLWALGRGGDRGRQAMAVCIRNVHLCSRGHRICVCDSGCKPICRGATSQPGPSFRVSVPSCVAQDVSAESGSGWPKQTQNDICFGHMGRPISINSLRVGVPLASPAANLP